MGHALTVKGRITRELLKSELEEEENDPAHGAQQDEQETESTADAAGSEARALKNLSRMVHGRYQMVTADRRDPRSYYKWEQKCVQRLGRFRFCKSATRRRDSVCPM